MIGRRYLAVSAIVVLAVAADITVRLTDRQSPPPVTAPAAEPTPGPSFPVLLPSSPPAAASPLYPPSTTPGGRPPGAPAPVRGRPAPGAPAEDGPSNASLDRLLEKDDVAPAGVVEQLDYFLGGGGEFTDCWDVPLGQPLSIDVTAYRAITQVPAICVRAFGHPSGPVTVTVTTPDGTVLSATRSNAMFGGEDAVRLPLPPGSPTGRYRVRAEQDGRTATTEFTAVPPAEPTMWLEPTLADPGDPVSLYLGGFPPGRPAEVHLYQCTILTAEYRTSIRVPIDSAGQAQITLTTSTFTDPTCYFLINPLVFDPKIDSPKDLPEHLRFWLRQ